MIHSMTPRSMLKDSQGSAMVEFAILAPTIFALLIGVFQIGLQMFGYNAIRSIAADTARFTIIEYQKRDILVAEQIENKAYALAVNAPYGLNVDNLTATVTTPTTDITGTKKFQIDLTYVGPNPLSFFGVPNPTMRTTRVVYVQA